MGSFDVGCAVSNLAIHEGDEIGFMLLREKANHYAEPLKHRIYATDDYEPFLPPVYGKYGDYGDLVEIQESNVTKTIEAIFKRPAEKVVEAIGAGRTYYDDYSPIFSLYMPDSVKNDKPSWDAPEHRTFELFGWTRIEAPEGAIDAYSWRGYTVVKTHNQSFGPDMESGVWSILHGEEVLKEGVNGHPNGSGQQITAIFSDLTGMLPGYPDEDWDAVKLLGSMYGMFFLKRVSDEMGAILLKDRYVSSSLERTKKDLEKELSIDVETRKEELEEAEKLGIYSKDMLAAVRQTLIKFPSIDRCVQLETEENALHVQKHLTADDLVASELLISTMTRLNRMVQPSYCGSQFGEDRLSSKLNRVTDTILEERAKYYGDGEEDED